MIHVFLLVVYLGVGEQRTLISNDMFFRDLNECNWYAKEITKRYGTAYCLPKYLKEDSIRIY